MVRVLTPTISTPVLRVLVNAGLAQANYAPLGGKVTRKGLLDWASRIWGDSINESDVVAAQRFVRKGA